MDHVICDELTVQGPVTAKYLDVKNEAHLDGVLDAQHGKFNKIVIKSEKIRYWMMLLWRAWW